MCKRFGSKDFFYCNRGRKITCKKSNHKWLDINKVIGNITDYSIEIKKYYCSLCLKILSRRQREEIERGLNV